MRLDSALKKVVPNISRPKKSRHLLMHCVQLPDNCQMREHSWPCRFHISLWEKETKGNRPNSQYELRLRRVWQYDSSELGEELCPVSSSLPLRVHTVYIRVSFSDTFLRWLPPFATNSCHYQLRKNFPFYTLLGSGCVLISYYMLSLIIAWLG
jgi:hypothetical protein